MSRLNKSGIDYLNYSWNFYTGCHNHENGVCRVGDKCYAKQWIQRFEKVYPNGFKPTFYEDSFLLPLGLKEPARIGVGFLGDLFGDWVDCEMRIVLPSESNWTNTVELKNLLFQVIEKCSQHTFVFLTKCPWNLPKWGKFPDNCWVGMTNCTGFEDLSEMANVKCKTRFVSYEPMYDYTKPDLRYIDWVIIGGQTKPFKPPQLWQVTDLVQECRQSHVPIFMKNNLLPIIENRKLIQEYPNV